MSLRPLLKPVLLALALLPVSAAACWRRRAAATARQPPRAVRAAATARQRDADALSDSVRRVERSTRGQVLSAERVPYDGRDVNRIKTVDDHGRVRVVHGRSAQSRRPPPADRRRAAATIGAVDVPASERAYTPQRRLNGALYRLRPPVA